VRGSHRTEHLADPSLTAVTVTVTVTVPAPVPVPWAGWVPNQRARRCAGPFDLGSGGAQGEW